MNILQINNFFYRKGGADTVFLNTVDLLKENGHSVCTLSRKNEKDQSRSQQDYFIRTPEFRFANLYNKVKHFPSFFYNKESVAVLQEIIRKHKPDVAHIHLLYNGISPSVLPLLKEHNVPVVMTVHDCRLLCPNYWMLGKQGNVCEKCIDKKYFRCTFNRCSDTYLNSLMLSLEAFYRENISPLDYIDRFVFPSHFLQDKFSEFNPRFSSKSDVLCNFSAHIYNDVAPKGNYFLYAGRLSREKGFLTLLEAVEEAQELKLKVAGTGTGRASVETWRATSLQQKNVDFLGFQSGKALDEFIRNASFIVVPSECYENNPMIVIEAMSAGKPVIGSRIGGIPELINEGENGFLFEAKNKNDLKKVLKKAAQLSDDEYRKMSENALQFARMTFEKNRHYKRLMEIYRGTIQHKLTGDCGSSPQ
jgi:glycosyltransferase involved in cell wall biosynthesis